MIRKLSIALMLTAFMGVAIVGCGKEDLTDLQKSWTEKDGEVAAKLAEVNTKYGEAQAEMQTVQTADMDTAEVQEYEANKARLETIGTQLADAQTKLDAQKEAMTKAGEAGKRAEYEAAWKTAEAEYEGLLASLNEIESQLGSMNAPDLAADPADTTTAPADAPAGSATGDTTTDGPEEPAGN